MEWMVMIVLWLLSYFLSKKKGASDGAAALVATGVTAGAYYTGATKYLADGATNLVSGGADSTAAPSTTTTAGSTNSIGNGSSGWGTAGSVVSSTVGTVGDVLKSWGPAGAAGVIATTGLVANSDSNFWRYVGLATVAFLLLRN